MEQNEFEQQERYYREIQDCIKLENLAKYIQNQDNIVFDLKKGYRGYSLPGLVWFVLIFLGLNVLFRDFSLESIECILAMIVLVAICIAYNKHHDKKIRSNVESIEMDRNEKAGMYNEIYNDVKDRFENGEFSIEMDCWHSGNELMKYFNENRAFSFEKARYYIDKQRYIEAAEQGRRNAYNQGYSNGNTDGYNNGYNNGYSQGKSAGYSKGKKDGEFSAYLRGYGDGRYLR